MQRDDVMDLVRVVIVSHDRVVTEARVRGSISVNNAILAIGEYGVAQHRAAVSPNADQPVIGNRVSLNITVLATTNSSISVYDDVVVEVARVNTLLAINPGPAILDDLHILDCPGIAVAGQRDAVTLKGDDEAIVDTALAEAAVNADIGYAPAVQAKAVHVDIDVVACDKEAVFAGRRVEIAAKNIGPGQRKRNRKTRVVAGVTPPALAFA
jgi:hypothetical protein